MFLGAYHFDGDPEDLIPAYEKLVAGYPPGGMDLHVSVVRPDGITVFDACPSAEVFDSFSSGPDFAGALAAVGLPSPTIEPLGEVRRAVLKEAVTP